MSFWHLKIFWTIYKSWLSMFLWLGCYFFLPLLLTALRGKLWRRFWPMVAGRFFFSWGGLFLFCLYLFLSYEKANGIVEGASLPWAYLYFLNIGFLVTRTITLDYPKVWTILSSVKSVYKKFSLSLITVLINT